MKFKIVKKQVKHGLFKQHIVEELDSQPITKKTKLRKAINDEVFDIYDSVADNAKMISLIFALLSRIWSILPDDIKSNLDKETKNMIDYAFEKYHSIQTRADVEFETNAQGLIDRLMDRQAKIGQLYVDIYEKD